MEFTVFGKGKVRHVLGKEKKTWDGKVGRSTWCNMFYVGFNHKFRDPTPEEMEKLPVCGGCMRTMEAKKEGVKS